MLYHVPQAVSVIFRFILFTLIVADKGCVCVSEFVDERLKHISHKHIHYSALRD